MAERASLFENEKKKEECVSITISKRRLTQSMMVDGATTISFFAWATQRDI
jgi:hypothetical protein